MILESKNGKRWISQAMDKLHAYLMRAPILVTDITGTEKCVDGVFIVHDGTKTKKFFPFDYDEDPKVWVHNIKNSLLDLYPEVIENITIERPLTPHEMAIYIEQGGDPEKVPTSKKEVSAQRLWRIDKVQVYKDIFILELLGERSSKNEDFNRNVEHIQNRYKFQGGSSVIFLNKYRNNDFANNEEAGKNFFESSMFIDELIKK
jgi:hypothetical protein